MMKHHPNVETLFRVAHDIIGPAMRSTLDHPLAKPLSRDEASIAIGCACIAIAAVPLAASSLSIDELDAFTENLHNRVREIRSLMAKEGIGVCRS